MNAVLTNSFTDFQSYLTQHYLSKATYTRVTVQYKLNPETVELEPYINIFLSKATEHYQENLSLDEWLEQNKDSFPYNSGLLLKQTWDSNKDGE